MFFLSCRIFEVFAITIIVLATACVAIRLVRKRRNLLRIPVILVSSPIALVAALFLGLQVLTPGCETYSVPLYSPKHDKLVRVTTDDEGALGGNSQVELLTYHGISSTYIYVGDWKTVDIKDVRWIDDRHISILYDASPETHFCTSTASVRVDCATKPPPPNSGALQSPDGDETAELFTAKDGTFQGTDAVILTGKIGYAYVYVGGPNTVVWPETHWRNDRELEIVSKGDPKACSNQIGITVICTHQAAK